MKNGIEKLKKQWNENPQQVLMVGALVVTATAKLLDSVSAAQGRRAYAKDVDRRVRYNNRGR